jgi:nucleoside-diphosphate-sugar epimerase
MACVLVTGASGFIGAEVAGALAARGDHVTAMDISIGPRLAQLRDLHSNLKTVQAEITEWSHVAGLIKDSAPDSIVHCAAIVGVIASAGAPILTMRVNVEGTVHVLESMRLFGVRRMVNISSEEIYGNFEADKIDEDHPCRPVMPYGISKYTVEQLSRDYVLNHGLECIHVRTCWVYGPGLPRPRVPKNLIDAAVGGKSLHLAAGADFCVDHVYIDDVVSGILAALDKPAHAYDAYHIATGKAPSLAEIVSIIKEKAPAADISVGPGHYLFGDRIKAVRKGALDISRARQELGYAPRYDIRAGLHAYFNHTLKMR